MICRSSASVVRRCARLALALPLLAASPALAQMYNAGDPCPELTPGRVFTQEGAAGPALVCNGTTLEVYESIKTGPMRKGVGTANPAAMLDVAGEAKIGNTSLACSATTEGAMRYNSTSKEMEYCNGTAWGSLAPAAGGGSPTYLGLTSTSYTGNLGGWFGANAKCVSDFGTGARMMTSGDLSHLARTSNFSGNGWIDCRTDISASNTGSNAYFYCLGEDTIYVFSSAFGAGSYTSCSDFSSSNSANKGPIVTTQGVASFVACNSNYPIHCVKD